MSKRGLCVCVGIVVFVGRDGVCIESFWNISANLFNPVIVFSVNRGPGNGFFFFLFKVIRSFAVCLSCLLSEAVGIGIYCGMRARDETNFGIHPSDLTLVCLFKN